MTIAPLGRRRSRGAAVIAVLLSLAVGACGAAPAPPTIRQTDTVEHAVTAQPAEHDVDLLLIGTSTISRWNTGCSFPGLTVVKRGLSGALIRDIDQNLDDLLGEMSPRQIVLYAGENDIVGNNDAEQVSQALLALIGRVQTRFPQARILVLAIKPTPARMAAWPRAVTVNAALRAAAAQGGYRVVEMASPLMGPDGPDPRYFVADGIHLTPEGYARIDAQIAAYLTSTPRSDGAGQESDPAAASRPAGCYPGPS